MPRRKLTTRERVRKFRKKDPFMSSIEMGKRLGLSSRGIRRILASEDELINKPPRPKHVSYCLVCNTLLDTKRKFCGSGCRFKYYRIKVNCSYCHIPFYRLRGQIMLSYRRGYTNIYCSYSCRDKGRRNRVDTPSRL